MEFDTLDPVPHLVVDEWATAPLVRAAVATWPSFLWPWWHRYDDATSVKYGTVPGAPFPPAVQLLLQRLAELDVSNLVADAFPDLSFHGGGMHTLPPGGFLAMHHDAEVHPLTGWSRVLNAILFVDGDGDLCLGEQGRCTISPAPGRLVLFATPDSPHAVAETTITRRTLACYWWADRNESGATQASFQ